MDGGLRMLLSPWSEMQYISVDKIDNYVITIKLFESKTVQLMQDYECSMVLRKAFRPHRGSSCVATHALQSLKRTFEYIHG